jgi:hypothetical protein
MPLQPTEELVVAVEGLYTTFQDYPLPSTTGPCPCCHSTDSERPLYSQPLRNLGPEELAQYASDALLTWGGLNEFRHFLPRIFEIAIFAEKFGLTDAEIVFAKLYHGEWRTWPQKEQVAIQNFLLAVWRAALGQTPSEDLKSAPEIETWLCCLAQAGGELSPYLSEWMDSVSPAAIWNLAALIYRTGMPLSRPTGIGVFWRGHMDQATQVSEWLNSEPVRKKLDRALETHLNEPFAEELFAAARVVS